MNDNSIALVIGGETKVVGMSVGEKLFVFSPVQVQFLMNLQKMKSVTAAALSVDKPEEWAQKFLKGAKFRSYVNLRLQEISIQAGMSVGWWYQFGKWASEGFRESWRAACRWCKWEGELTNYEVEGHRADDMTVEVPCPVCYKACETERVRERFEPSREQVVAWQELGSRLIPKVERVHHQFENVNIEFQSEEEKQHG